MTHHLEMETSCTLYFFHPAVMSNNWLDGSNVKRSEYIVIPINLMAAAEYNGRKQGTTTCRAQQVHNRYSHPLVNSLTQRTQSPKSKTFKVHRGFWDCLITCAN